MVQKAQEWINHGYFALKIFLQLKCDHVELYSILSLLVEHRNK
jgi:hypothetical protein